jgi:hypothetical protein
LVDALARDPKHLGNLGDADKVETRASHREKLRLTNDKLTDSLIVDKSVAPAVG